MTRGSRLSRTSIDGEPVRGREGQMHAVQVVERRRLGRLRRLAAIVIGAGLASSVAGAATAVPVASRDPAVITDWNATAVATIVVDAGKANAEAFLWYGFTHAAIYNAVVGITRDYELYNWDIRGPRSASPEAAAAAAAHDVLLNYFPASAGRLNAAYAASLAKIPGGPAKFLGVRYGQRAAAHFIALRVGDGRQAPVTFDVPPAPGVWRPTPPAFAPMFDPWLGQVRPLLIESGAQFDPGRQPAMTSAAYTADYNEVKAFGSKTGSQRTAAQTETALFFSDTTLGPVQGSLRSLVTRRHLGISDSARLFAATDMSMADAVISAWYAKLKYAFWRPITAIRLAADDGNEATIADEAWEPLLVTPPYPDWPSGLCTVVAAWSRALTGILGTDDIDLDITSAAAGVTRHYDSAEKLNRDAIDARVWSGIHFRFADTAANTIGNHVGDWALDHYFAPLR